MNREFPGATVKVAREQRNPVSLAVGLVSSQKKDLMALARNKNIPSVVTGAAPRAEEAASGGRRRGSRPCNGHAVGAVRALEAALDEGKSRLPRAQSGCGSQSGRRSRGAAERSSGLWTPTRTLPQLVGLGPPRAQRRPLRAGLRCVGRSNSRPMSTSRPRAVLEQGRPSRRRRCSPALRRGDPPDRLGTLERPQGSRGLPTAAGCPARRGTPRRPAGEPSRSRFDDADPAAARRCLDHAAGIAPADPATRFHLGCLWGLLSPEAAERHHATLPPEAVAWRDSWA